LSIVNITQTGCRTSGISHEASDIDIEVVRCVQNIFQKENVSLRSVDNPKTLILEHAIKTDNYINIQLGKFSRSQNQRFLITPQTYTDEYSAQ